MGEFAGAEWLFTIVEMESGAILCDKMFPRRGRWSFWCLELAAILGIAALGGEKMAGNLFPEMRTALAAGVLWLAARLGYRGSGAGMLSLVLLWFTLLFTLDFTAVFMMARAAGQEDFGIRFFHECSGTRVLLLGLLRLLDCLILGLLVRFRERLARHLEKYGEILAPVSFICVFFLIQLQNVQRGAVNQKTAGVYAGNALALLLTFLLYLSWFAYLRSQREKQEKKRRQDRQQLQWEVVKGENLQCRRLLHDEKNHLRMVASMLEDGQPEEARSYVEQLMGEIGSGVDRIWTGDRRLDQLLNWKIAEGKRRGIQFQVDTEGFVCGISETDLCALFGNLLDNAMEACAGLAEEKRRILVRMRRQGKILSVRIENPFVTAPRQEKGKFLSAKRDFQQPGCGMEIVRELVCRYDGELKCEYDDRNFCVEMMLIMKGETL
jgi:hypothetical protein